MGFRTSFRSVQDWSDSTNGNIKLNTASDEAAKMFDATLDQYCGWYDDESFDGLAGSLSKMQKADPEFLLGFAFAVQLELMAAMATPNSNKDLSDKLKSLNALAKQKQTKQNLNPNTDHELLYVKVANELAENKLKEAANTLEVVNTLYPHDVPALKTSQGIYFYRGESLPMRHSAINSLRQLSTKNPYKGYCHGLMSFAYEESHQFELGMKQALQAIDLIPHDTWAIHNYAHCLLMQAKDDEGLAWMADRKCDWSKCQALFSHQSWHTAVFKINTGSYADAVALLDEDILPECTANSNSLNLHDAASMIYRMELVDLFSIVAGNTKNGDCSATAIDKSKTKNRWAPVYDVCKPHIHEHLVGFNDAHYMMSYLGTGDLASAQDLIDTLETTHNNMEESQNVVKPLLEAMLLYHNKEFDACAEKLVKIRFEIRKIGGSHAQRDVFEQLLCVSALKSEKESNISLGLRMVEEREAMSGKVSYLTELLKKMKDSSHK